MKKILIASLLLIIGIHVSFAQQEPELFHIRYGITPVSLTGSKYFLHQFESSVKIPVAIRNNYQVAAGIAYEGLWTNGDSLLGAKNLQGISGQVLFNRNLNYHRGLQAFISGGVFSDFKDITGEDLRVAGGIRYKTKLHENFTFSFGLLYSKQFFGSLIAPFADFNWKISQRLSLSGPIPISPKLKYKLSSVAKLSFFLKPENASFRLSETESRSRYLQKKQWNTGFGLDYTFAKHWIVSIKTGVSFKQQFEIYEASEGGVFSIMTIDVKGGNRQPVSWYRGNALSGEITLAWLLDQNDL